MVGMLCRRSSTIGRRLGPRRERGKADKPELRVHEPINVHNVFPLPVGEGQGEGRRTYQRLPFHPRIVPRNLFAMALASVEAPINRAFGPHSRIQHPVSWPSPDARRETLNSLFPPVADD